MKLLVCGGDIRQIYMARALSDKGFDTSITLFEKAEVDDACADFRSSVRACDALILPLPAGRGGTCLNAPLSDARVSLDTLASLLTPSQRVCGGMLPQAFCDILTERGIPFFDFGSDEKLLQRNAVPTAEGVLGILIREMPVTVCTSHCLITGFGRCGKAIAALLTKNGASVTVAARSEEQRRDAERMGCKSCPLLRLSDGPIEPFDAVVNTVPHRILERAALERLRRDTLLIETASAPFGIDFDAAADLHLRVIKAAALPGKTSPKTAGEILADSITKALTK